MIVNIILILLLTITSLISIIIGLGLLLQYGERKKNGTMVFALTVEKVGNYYL